jgi:hypothetical protein
MLLNFPCRICYLSYRLACLHRAYVLSCLTCVHEHKRLCTGYWATILTTTFASLVAVFWPAGNLMISLYAITTCKDALPPPPFPRASLTMSAKCSWLCTCQLGISGHALTKPHPHQHILGKLPLLWTADTPASPSSTARTLGAHSVPKDDAAQ